MSVILSVLTVFAMVFAVFAGPAAHIAVVETVQLDRYFSILDALY